MLKDSRDMLIPIFKQSNKYVISDCHNKSFFELSITKVALKSFQNFNWNFISLDHGQKRKVLSYVIIGKGRNHDIYIEIKIWIFSPIISGFQSH